MKLIFRFTLTVLLFVVASWSLFGQTREVRFDVDINTALIRPGPLGDLSTRFTNAGAVIHHNGMFHMFRAAFSTWGTVANVDHMISSDGLGWISPQQAPVFTHHQVPFDAMALPTSVIVEADGTWVLYFFLVPHSGSQDQGVARATAPQPEGPWVMDAETVLNVGSRGEWDSLALPAPRVVKIESQYFMYYGGQQDRSGDTLIGLATSEDGVHWIKYDDPSTAEAPFAESDPVFFPDTEAAPWENPRVVQDPRVVRTPDGLVMLYSSYNGFRPHTAHPYGLAVSDDGIHWERISDSPVFTGRDVGNRVTWFHELAYADDTYFMYVSIAEAGGGTSIYGGTYNGPLR